MLWQVWWVWVAGGFLLGVLEVLAPGFIFLGFALGAVLTVTGPYEMGVIVMGLGLVFQVISLVRIKRAKAKANSEGSSDARG